MTTKHIAIDPAGFTHKRSSKSRGYSHTVIATPSYRHALAWASKISKQDIDNFAYHWDLATTGSRAVEVDEPVNYRWIDNKLEPVKP